jgi:hypothetical protein
MKTKTAVVRAMEVFGIALVLSHSPARGSVVYDNPTPFDFFTFAGEVGDTVTLAGSDRLITSVSVGVAAHHSLTPLDDSFQLRLWSANGLGEATTLLWESANLNVQVGLNVQMITFDVPSVQVPDTIVWSVLHQTTADVAFQYGSPVLTGSSPDYTWSYVSLSPYQTKIEIPGEALNFMAHIEAAPVPEPSTAILALAAAGFLFRRRLTS